MTLLQPLLIGDGNILITVEPNFKVTRQFDYIIDVHPKGGCPSNETVNRRFAQTTCLPLPYSQPSRIALFLRQ